MPIHLSVGMPCRRGRLTDRWGTKIYTTAKVAHCNQLRGLVGARRKEGCREVERPGQENA
jgi:hypothetical protein